MKRWLMAGVAASMLVVAGCGSDSGSDSADSTPTTMSQDNACAEVRTLELATQKLTEDVANSEIDMSGMMNQLKNIAERTTALADAAPPGPMKDATAQWAKATETQLNDPTDENQIATFDARDRVDDACGFPRGPRDKP